MGRRRREVCETDIQERRREGSAEVERERGGVEDLGDALLRFCSVVLSGPLDGLYEGLPVIVVDEWREVCATDTQERRREGSGEVQRERGGDVHSGGPGRCSSSVLFRCPQRPPRQSLRRPPGHRGRRVERVLRDGRGRQWGDGEREKEIFTAED